MHNATPPLQPRLRSQPDEEQQLHPSLLRHQERQQHLFRPPAFPTPTDSEETLANSAAVLEKQQIASSLQSVLDGTNERSLSLSAPTTPCISRRSTQQLGHDFQHQGRQTGPSVQQRRSQTEAVRSSTHKRALPLLAASFAEIQSLPGTSTDVSFSRRELRFRHQRTHSVQGAIKPHSLPTNENSGAFAADSSSQSTAAIAAVAALRRSSKQSRRGSVAVSANLSITQGLPVDLDLIDMDDDEEADGDDEDESRRLAYGSDCSTKSGGCDADQESMALDDANEGSVGYTSTYGWRTSECGDQDTSERIRNMHSSRANSLDTAHLTGMGRRQSMNVPRNKAFLRLLSLVEEDKQPLASEMEHEGQITRSIRHTNVQEWLRSASAHLNRSVMQATPPLEETSASSAPVTASIGLASPLRNPSRIAASKAAAVRDAAFDQTGATSAPAREILFPASPASSVVSSPKPMFSGAPENAVSTMTPTNLTISTTPARSAKRKSSEDSNSSPGEQSQGMGTPSRLNPHKRLAMSPSGLRSQISFAGSRRTLTLPASHSGPSSPQLLSRPVALPATAYHQHMHPVPSSSAGTCPIVPVGGSSGASSSGSVISSRARSRSGAGLGSGINGSGLSILQANGVFSRMNINDKMDESPC
ncbi:hypothetical protein GGF40_002514 [Coemansia sp. RSA 1286]|nr:hypothetical protein GGF40_002514 [Coemansia sp. RSA 1286]